MHRIDRDPVAWDDLPDKTSPGGGFTFRTLATNGPDAGMAIPRSTVTVLLWPDGTTAPWGSPNQLEYHTLHEEIFVLQGALCFDHWYRLNAPAYCNHPPFWLHPTNFWAEGDLVMLLRESHDPVVQLQSIPKDWDGTESYARGKPTQAVRGVSRLQLDALPWEPIMTRGGDPTGIEAKRIWDDLDDGWVTWLMRVPPQWSLPERSDSSPGGDEVFVIEGDLRIVHRGKAVVLTSYGFAADTSSFGASAGWASSHGCVFVRWTKQASSVWAVR